MMQVIIALADKKREHIPYRQSKLTHVLKDSIGTNFRSNHVHFTLMLYFLSH